MNYKVFSKFVGTLLWVGVTTSSWLVIAPAHARVLKWGTTSWNRARLLPSGEQKLTFKLQSFQTSTAFGADGSVQSTGHQYGYTTRFSDLIENSGDKGLEIRSLLKEQGISEDTPVYTTEFAMDTNEVQTELTWTRGLTPWWMVGISIPYIQSETKIRSSRKLSPEYQKLKGQLKANGNNQPVDTFVNKEKSKPTDLELENNDYDQVNGTVEYRGIGDVELLSQVKLLEQGSWYGALRQRLVVPSGKNEGPYTYFKSNSADGQMDIGLDALMDYQATQNWVVTGLLGYTFQLADTQAARVPDGRSSPIDWKVDNDVDRDLGDVFIARFSSVYQFLQNYWMTAGLEMTHKGQDEYSGTQYASWQYDLMENNTEETRQLARLGLRYTSDSWRYSYLSKTSFTAGLEYLSILAGENTPKADAAALELSVSY